MWQAWRLYLIAAGVALGWLGTAFFVVPSLGEPVQLSRAATPSLPSVTGQAAPRTFRGNVYHIVFDAYQSEAYQYLLPKTPELKQLPLTYYPQFRANSPWTYFSMAELFASDFYTPGMSPESWHTAALQGGGLMGYLANAGVRLHVYPLYDDYCYGGGLTICETEAELKRTLLGAAQARQTVVDLWFLKLIPSTLKRELNARSAGQDGTLDSTWYTNWDYGFSIMDAIRPAETPRDRDLSFFSVQQFMQALDDEDARPATGQYVFVHLMLPHGPYIMDSQCNYAARANRSLAEPEQYLEQVQCADKLMVLLERKLAGLGRLDNSLIIFQGDHGNYWYPADMGVLQELNSLDVASPRLTKGQPTSTWPSETVEVRASAMLAIKFPGQSQATSSNRPVQMIDIAPTILRYFDIDPSWMLGIPIQDLSESPARERLFFASDFILVRNNRRVFSKYRYLDGQWKFEEDIVPGTDTDALFTLGFTR